MKTKIIEIIQTCGACPSQWEGKTDDNRSVYVRYRWGNLTVQVSEPEEGVDKAVRGTYIFDESVGDGLDGCMSLEELQNHTKDVIIWS